MGKAWPQDSTPSTALEKKSWCVSHLPEVGYFVLHKSFMRAAPTDYSSFSFPSQTAPLLLRTLWSRPPRQQLSIFAKRSSQSPVRGSWRSCRGLPDTAGTLMRCPEPFPTRACVCVCMRKDSRCSSTRGPRGPPPNPRLRNFISGPGGGGGGEPGPDFLLQ